MDVRVSKTTRRKDSNLNIPAHSSEFESTGIRPTVMNQEEKNNIKTTTLFAQRAAKPTIE